MSQREPNLIGDSFQEKLPFEDFLVPEKQRDIASNLTTALRNIPVQISFLPSISTNRWLGGGADVNFSLNILAGYSYGVNGVEIGGLANLDRGDVKGFQAGGLANIVGGNVKGLQVGGLYNYVKGEVEGVQVAGLFNQTPKAVKGIQIAGLFNKVPDDISHMQIGGLFNTAHNIGGFQIGGLGNQAKGNVGGFQIAGLHNYAAGDVKAFQIAGLANVAKGNVDGFQVAGLYNQAKVVNGFQIGLINKADSVGGFCVGLVNIIKHGYKAITMSSNDAFQTNLGYKAGRREFYNILNIGYRFGPDHVAMSYGAGFGTMKTLGPLYLSVEATCNQVIEEGLPLGRLNMLIPARVHLGIPLGGKLELFAGASANLHIANAMDNNGEFETVLGNRPFWRHEGGSTLVQGWMGYNAGINILL